MEFEWDDEKEVENLRKHDVPFSYAINVFVDPLRRTYTDERFDYGEVRSVTRGMIDGTLYIVVHTDRFDRIRIISARPATRQERRAYGNSPHDH